MKIHFICRGNTFRSRLAEIYLKSLKKSKYKPYSSGILARKNIKGPICWYTFYLLEKENLNKYDKKNWTQTSKDNLLNSDYIIFMNKSIYNYCIKHFKFKKLKKPFEVWNINDIEDSLNKKQIKDINKVLKTSYLTFSKIKKNIDNFVKKNYS